MIEKFEEYVGTLPLTKVVKDRINEVLVMNNKIKHLEIQDIFVCESKNEEGSRNYSSLWLFTETYCIECKNFLNSNDFDITPYLNRIEYCSIVPINFDLETPNPNSIVRIHFHLGTGVSGDLIASENNCLSALKIYQKYIVSNLND